MSPEPAQASQGLRSGLTTNAWARRPHVPLPLRCGPHSPLRSQGGRAGVHAEKAGLSVLLRWELGCGLVLAGGLFPGHVGAGGPENHMGPASLRLRSPAPDSTMPTPERQVRLPVFRLFLNYWGLFSSFEAILS